jgi:hypothetical protein
MAKRTRITIETDSLLILRSRSSKRAWCTRCAAEVEMIALKHAGVVSNLELEAPEEWLNSGELHRLQATVEREQHRECDSGLPGAKAVVCSRRKNKG